MTSDERRELMEAIEAAAAATPAANGGAFDRLFDKHPLPMLIYDYETLAILNANESAQRLSGYSHAEIICLSLHDLLPAEDVPKLLELISEVPHFDRSGPWRHRAKDGTVVQLLISSHAMTSGPYAARLLMAENPDEAEL